MGQLDQVDGMGGSTADEQIDAVRPRRAPLPSKTRLWLSRHIEVTATWVASLT